VNRWHRTESFIPTHFPVAVVAIALLISGSVPAAFAGQKPVPFKLQSAPSIPSKVPSATGSYEESEVGMSDWLNQERIVFISGEISPERAEVVVSQLLYLDRKSPGKDIYLYINSPGGEISAGLAIYDTMRSLQSDVVTVGLGEASSMGSVLLASGTKGKRVALPNTRIMIHQPWQFSSGMQASDIAIAAKEILYQKSLLNRMLSELTGQPLKRIEGDTDRDFYMSAQEAKTYGIIDKTINQLPSANRPLKN
jgi:ATP-dependent Clp protease, protease subunit